MLKKCLIFVVAVSLAALTIELLAEEDIDADRVDQRPRMGRRNVDEDMPIGRAVRQRGRANIAQPDTMNMREVWLDELTEAYREKDDEKLGRLIRRMNQAKQRFSQRGSDMDMDDFDLPRGREDKVPQRRVSGNRHLGLKEKGLREQRGPKREAMAMQGRRGARGAGRNFAPSQNRMRGAGTGFGPMQGRMGQRGMLGRKGRAGVGFGQKRGAAIGSFRSRIDRDFGPRAGATLRGFRGRGKARGEGMNIRQRRECPECGGIEERVRDRQGQLRQIRGRQGNMGGRRRSADYGWSPIQRRGFYR